MAFLWNTFLWHSFRNVGDSIVLTASSAFILERAFPHLQVWRQTDSRRHLASLCLPWVSIRTGKHPYFLWQMPSDISHLATNDIRQNMTLLWHWLRDISWFASTNMSSSFPTTLLFPLTDRQPRFLDCLTWLTFHYSRWQEDQHMRWCLDFRCPEHWRHTFLRGFKLSSFHHPWITFHISLLQFESYQCDPVHASSFHQCAGSIHVELKVSFGIARTFRPFHGILISIHSFELFCHGSTN